MTDIDVLRQERDQWKADCELRSQTAVDRLEALKVCEAKIERLRAALLQIRAVCDDNASPLCNHLMALAVVRGIANANIGFPEKR